MVAAEALSIANFDSPMNKMVGLQLQQSQVPKTSPAVLALKAINDALKQKVVSPQNIDPTNSPQILNNEAIQQSIQKAELLKSGLVDALKKDNLAEIRVTIQEIERAQLCKEALEISRIGAVVNGLRKSIADSNPELAKQCRQLIKSWRSNVTEASRPASSCGSSTSGTPGLASPAIRRGLTPRTGKNVTPSGTTLQGVDGQSASGGYAPRGSPQAAQKRRIDPSPPQSAKKAKLSPIPEVSSVVAARQNVQSTEQLVAALGMDNILANFTKRSESPKPVVSSYEPVEKSEPEKKRGRKSKTSVPQAPLRLKIKFGGQPSVSSESADSAIHSATSSSSSPDLSKEERIEDEPMEEEKPAEISAAKSKMSWYDKLVTVEELERRAEAQKQLLTKNLNKTKITELSVLKQGTRDVLVMPYIDLDDQSEQDMFVGLMDLDLLSAN
ncbi:unnamed protein product [Bursaphelenchus xylophilus]|uniref:(pine wood nematode) hypothetical protein n=1 Tax=Bursaphelenchus xylophilus TaxID=6326 RepID=A0A1I7RVZ1_BURXY|nr:unnamed protein product [Bursaphelenchus xylophilus]CAG9094901.1 unnamed protein product [Bursaphelenchus xylophilus]